ncbi:MAG: class I SAM-dependent methyltransferase [Acidimicrobiales bacterium]|jgi:SAM-dependent methyltransferase
MAASPASEANSYFDLMYPKWTSAWERFGEHPQLDNTRFLDFGCGYGAFSIRAAQEGASVVGLDLNPVSIEGARAIAAARFPDLDVTYVETRIEDLTETFDVIMTNEVFEHVLDLPACLRSLHDRLRPGGVLYAGWGPLWYSPTGGHQMTVKWGGVPVPWSHLIKPIGRAQFRRTQGRDFSDNPEYSQFNYLRPADYERMIAASGFRVDSWRVNPGRHPAYRVLRAASKLAPTPFTANVYAILRRPA